MLGNRKLGLLALIIVIAVVVPLTAACLAKQSASPRVPADVPPDFAKLYEAYRVLSQDYVDKGKLDPKTLADGAVRGMVDSINDPFTSYFDPTHYSAIVDDIQGGFEGIGAVVTVLNGKIVIVSPMADSPADKAGLRPGDAILQVEGQSTDGQTLTDVVNKIRGPVGSKVTLLIQRAGSTEQTSVELVRGHIKVKTVASETVAPGIERVQITQFAGQTTDELASVLKDVMARGAKGIILDLRNNPGGLLNVTVDAASQFLKDGLVLYEIDSTGKRTDWNVKGHGLATDVPMVVLVNKGSASGAEVLAGALQARKRAQLIGTQTFGKGSVNIPRQLSDGSGLYITVAHWYTPSGALIQGKGLTPDIVVEETEADFAAGKDPQLDNALGVIQPQIKGTVQAS